MKKTEEKTETVSAEFKLMQLSSSIMCDSYFSLARFVFFWRNESDRSPQFVTCYARRCLMHSRRANLN